MSSTDTVVTRSKTLTMDQNHILLGGVFGTKFIRVTPPLENQQRYFSIRDAIMAVCDQNNDRAGKTWRNLRDDTKDEVRHFLTNFQFPGRGQAVQQVITFKGLLKLVMMLPGEEAKKYRSQFSDIITMYFAGDERMHAAVDANGSSSAPMNVLAREAVAAEIDASNTISNTQHLEIQAAGVKRLREETECVLGMSTRAREEAESALTLVKASLLTDERRLQIDLARLAAKRELIQIEDSSKDRDLTRFERQSEIDFEKVKRQEEMRTKEEEKRCNMQLDLATKLAAIHVTPQAPQATQVPPIAPTLNPPALLPMSVHELAKTMADWGTLTDQQRSSLVYAVGRAIVKAPHNIPCLPDKVDEQSPSGTIHPVNRFEYPFHGQIVLALQGQIQKMRRADGAILPHAQTTINTFWN